MVRSILSKALLLLATLLLLTPPATAADGIRQTEDGVCVDLQGTQGQCVGHGASGTLACPHAEGTLPLPPACVGAGSTGDTTCVLAAGSCAVGHDASASCVLVADACAVEATSERICVHGVACVREVGPLVSCAGEAVTCLERGHCISSPVYCVSAEPTRICFGNSPSPPCLLVVDENGVCVLVCAQLGPDAGCVFTVCYTTDPLCVGPDAKGTCAFDGKCLDIGPYACARDPGSPEADGLCSRGRVVANWDFCVNAWITPSNVACYRFRAYDVGYRGCTPDWDPELDAHGACFGTSEICLHAYEDPKVCLEGLGTWCAESPVDVDQDPCVGPLSRGDVAGAWYGCTGRPAFCVTLDAGRVCVPEGLARS